MNNPWKEIPLSDYEGHMTMPDVGQSSMLSDEFKTLLTTCRSKSAAVIGCAGGNGFDEAFRSGVERIVGIDINCDYLEEAKSRYASKFLELEMYCTNVEEDLPNIRPVDMIYAALIFEYVDVEKTLSNLKNLCKKDGVLAILLQLPKQSLPAVSSSPYTSLSKLNFIMRLVPPSEIHTAAKDIGFSLTSLRTITVESGKEFALQTYSLSTSLRSLATSFAEPRHD